MDPASVGELAGLTGIEPGSVLGSVERRNGDTANGCKLAFGDFHCRYRCCYPISS